MKAIYLMLAIIGAILPYSHFIPFLQTNGLDSKLLVSQLFANDISSFFATDFLICCVVFFCFLYQETKKHQIRHAWIYVVATLTIGLSFSLPLFLFFRQKAMERVHTF
ncbi:DUF2834 domain-containing protein [Brevibacillus reuszeri]|nr:DUF2834 domain-containing protein [Brevibacillus reuszeri]MED1857747.1 DUF2834 domain-containing protein [Brevibacillus reuszeri]